MTTIKDAIIMIKNAWKEVKLYYIICSVVYTCISVFIYLLGNKRNNSYLLEKVNLEEERIRYT
jgi:hypothetical protein